MTTSPNILILFTDMQRADTIQALGNPVIRTPHLDRLANEGTAFTNAFSPSPVCIPARCSLHYGLYPFHTGCNDNGRMMDDNGASLPALLARHGYRTQAIGKCHFTPDRAALRGYHARLVQEECTSDPDQDDYIAWLRDHGHDHREAHGARSEMYYVPQISTLPMAAHPSQWIGDRSCDFIREAAAGQQPWHLFASFIHPHPPFSPPKPWHRLYRTPAMPLPRLPEHRAELMTWVNHHQNRYKYRDRGLDLNFIRTATAYYYACISFVDFQIGRILSTLEDCDQLDNTLILFSSDHGELLGDYGCFGKRSMHDPSARVPLLARLPGRFPAGGRCATATSLVDLLPTCLAAVGSGTDDLPHDGLDLAPLAAGADPDRTVYSQFAVNGRALLMAVNRAWKYVYSAGDDQEFLFDRVSDPDELVNRTADPAAAAAQTALRTDLWQQLIAAGHDEYLEGDGAQRRWPRIDFSQRYADPDAGLLVQDYADYRLHLPGYDEAPMT